MQNITTYIILCGVFNKQNIKDKYIYLSTTCSYFQGDSIVKTQVCDPRRGRLTSSIASLAIFCQRSNVSVSPSVVQNTAIDYK